MAPVSIFDGMKLYILQAPRWGLRDTLRVFQTARARPAAGTDERYPMGESVVKNLGGGRLSTVRAVAKKNLTL